MQTELQEKLETPITQAQINAWRNRREYVIYFSLKSHEPLARREIAALKSDNLRIFQKYNACFDNINRAKNKEHIILYTVEEMEKTLIGANYSIAELEAN